VVLTNARYFALDSVSSDEETFLSADDLRVNLWHLEKGERGFNVLDLKPENMEDLNEVITCAQFHPEHCNLFAISTSRAVVKLNDLRASALCDGSAKEFTVPDVSLQFPHGSRLRKPVCEIANDVSIVVFLLHCLQDASRNQSFFSEIVASIADLKFSPDGKYFCTRDYEVLSFRNIKLALITTEVHYAEVILLSINLRRRSGSGT